MVFQKGHKAWNKGLTKETDERIKKMGFKKGHKLNIGRIGWNKGLTKETDERVKQQSLTIKENIKINPNFGGRGKPQCRFKKGNKAWNKGLTKETDERVKEKGENKKGIHPVTEWKKGHKLNIGRKRPDLTERNLKNNPMLNEETRIKSSATKQGILPEQWKGFTSRDPYGQEFDNKFKRAIRNRDNQVCMNCGIHREQLNEALSIHHINDDRQNSIPQNCICLCRKCHNFTKQNRPYWKKLFQDKLNKLYNYQYTEKGDVILDLNKGGQNETH